MYILSRIHTIPIKTFKLDNHLNTLRIYTWDSPLKKERQSSLSSVHILSGKCKKKIYNLDIVVFNNRGKRYFRSLSVVFLATWSIISKATKRQCETNYFIVVVGVTKQ